MSRCKTKRLRQECRERLGRSPFKADSSLYPVRGNEFRFFKRHGCTAQEMRGAWDKHLAARERADREREINYERILAGQRLTATRVQIGSRIISV
jgi:hypothetical protein